MFVIVAKYLIPKGYSGLTLFPFIILTHESDKANPILINHETIHIRQQLQLLIVPFFVWYGLEFLIRFIQFRNWKQAYQNISFEREAYSNESNLNYLGEMSFWSFLKYI